MRRPPRSTRVHVMTVASFACLLPCVCACLQHVRLSPVTSDAYWDFSIDELARYDTPAMFDLVLKVSG